MIERCVDASVAAKWAIKGEAFRTKALRFLRDAETAPIHLIAPAFFTSEVDTAVRKHVHDGKMTRAQAQKAYGHLDRAPVEIRDHPQLRQRARELAEQFNQRTVYDTTYIALAELRGCEFWTADKDLYKAVKNTLSFVKYLADYP